ncbi:hypothetical protein SDRG_05711 [Saprolegnia diclina VS20]|uniref:Uncharacterized protein n=1 Tax=Saprolegnia diclina (strain VS20) TaxID=1156394 RepID=T0S238_SAPDV|nr:hypothetical protein SDRG_05711 [Saprolegnia diclina VS20]EQC36882.1 hypothetical protein SDRG_05711 [Saprolegnia diclina VS20]|eukprot:XP_008609663.1 hypothetical protein SDRG_05711 [Saprolegnia diclina VS20]
MTFRSVVLQPEIASMVFEFQFGLYEDVRAAFVACNELVEFDATKSLYACDKAFANAFAPNTAWPGFPPSRPSLYALLNTERDDRLPLHLAIVGGFVQLAKRMFQCRPDLASEDAIVLSFVSDRLDLVEFLLERRAQVPELRRRRINPPGTPMQRRMASVYQCWLSPLLAREDTRGVELLRVFDPSLDEWSPHERWHALRSASLENAVLALECFPWLLYPRIMDDAAHRGFLPLVQTLHERGVACSTNAMDYAAANGHLEIIAFLHAHRREGCTVEAMNAAAANGHLEIIAFLHAHRREGCTVEAMNDAAANGHVNVVEFLQRHRTEGCTTSALTHSITQGHLNTHMLDIAANNGHLAVVQYLHTLGSFTCTVDAVDRAASAGHHDVVAFLLTHRSEGCTVDAVVQKALQGGHLRTVQYLVSRGYPMPTQLVRLREGAWRKPEITGILELLAAHGTPWSADWLELACMDDNVLLFQFCHKHAIAACGPEALDEAVEYGAWGIAAYLMVHGAAAISAKALASTMRSGRLDLAVHMLQRQPELRHDTLLQVAVSDHNAEVMRYLLAAGIGQPRDCLRQIAGRRQHVSESRLLLSYCMHATSHLDNISFLLDLIALPDRHHKTTLQLLTPELTHQARKASSSLEVAPRVAPRATTLLQAGEVVDAALALILGPLGSTDATITPERLETRTRMVHGMELQTELPSLLSRKRK